MGADQGTGEDEAKEEDALELCNKCGTSSTNSRASLLLSVSPLSGQLLVPGTCITEFGEKL